MKKLAKIWNGRKGKAVRRYLTITFGMLTVLTFFAPSKATADFWSAFGVLRIIVMLIFLGLLLSYNIHSDLFKKFDSMSKSAKVLSIVVPVIVLIFVIIQAAWPDFAVWLARCDDMKKCGVNFRHFIFIKAAFELIALVILVGLFIKFARAKQALPSIVLGFLALVVFMMAGEELSWGQRIFDWATPDSFRQLNAQHEMNLHDMATQLFQNSWYFGCWLLLVLLPFFRSQIAKFLQKFKKLAFLSDFLPPAYFVLIFAAAYGLVDPLAAETGVRYSSILFSVLGTAAILIYAVIRARGHLAEHLTLTLGVFAIALFFNLLFSDTWNKNSGVPTEYLELFISFGIMLWTIYLKKHLKIKDKN